jgi:hypothetical protein
LLRGGRPRLHAELRGGLGCGGALRRGLWRGGLLHGGLLRRGLLRGGLARRGPGGLDLPRRNHGLALQSLLRAGTRGKKPEPRQNKRACFDRVHDWFDVKKSALNGKDARAQAKGGFLIKIIKLLNFIG